MSNETLTRADLSDAVYKLDILDRNAEPHEPLSREASADLVESILRLISNSLVNGESVKISSFGAFEVRDKAARVGRNPKTGEEAPITPRRVLSFRASHVLKNRINTFGEKQRA